MRAAPIEFWELSAPAFRRAVPPLLEVYTAAMAPPPGQLAGRRAHIESHTLLAGFHSVVAVTTGGAAAVGFAYGFFGQRGQWWHDAVTAAVRQRDTAAVRRWFTAPFEIAEVHVHPRWQGRGVGRTLLERLTAPRSERTAVLSTRCGESPARGLYRSCGFVDVLPEFYFPGTPDQPFAIMAAPLPLPGRRTRPAAGRSPASPSTG